jgi:hypothetical protein
LPHRSYRQELQAVHAHQAEVRPRLSPLLQQRLGFVGRVVLDEDESGFVENPREPVDIAQHRGKRLGAVARAAGENGFFASHAARINQ